LLEYLKIIGGESDNLTFGPEGHPNTVEQEEAFIESLTSSETHLMVVADYDGEIIGDASLSGSPRERLRHSLELGISVKKAYWRMAWPPAYWTPSSNGLELGLTLSKSPWK
jgi:RimJ/RimL family protein N-acetyltransferase